MDLILAKNKVLYISQGKVKEPTDDVGKENFKENGILVMSLIMDSVKNNLILYISTHSTSNKMYGALSKLFTIKNIGQVASLNNDLQTIKSQRMILYLHIL